MSQLYQDLLLTFVPLFVAIDAIGNLPIILAVSADMSHRERRRMVNIAVLTASGVGLFFLVLGKVVLRLLGIEVGHFAIAGGLVLLALSLRDMLTGKLMEAPAREEMLAVVPIGTPITVGPATITTLLLLSDEYRVWIVLLSLALNLLATWVLFQRTEILARILGKGGLKAVAKVMSLFLAAIAIRMVFRGIDLI